MKLSNTVLKMAKKRNIELCECFDNELHIIINPEENDCACVAYQLNEDKTDYQLLHMWDKSFLYPEVIKDEKTLKDLVKRLGKGV